ncbi:MAG: hypothetical protein H0V82_10245 [Candidatus Protochlamydia sp.]|nr:hypothetical protein [Candidatus Protochlamydia sp.]
MNKYKCCCAALLVTAVASLGYFASQKEEKTVKIQDSSLIASANMGGRGGSSSSGSGSEGGTIEIDFGSGGGGWDNGSGGIDWSSSGNASTHINVYEEPHSQGPHINVYEDPLPQEDPYINVYEQPPVYYPPPTYTPPTYTPPAYTPPVSTPPPVYTPFTQPTPSTAPQRPAQSLPVIVIINDTPVVRVGDIIVIRIRILQAARPMTIYWRIRGVNKWILDGEIFRRRATRPGVIPITVIIKDKNGLYSQRQTTYVTVLKCTTCPASSAKAPILPKPAPIKAAPKSLAGCYDTDFGILRLAVEGKNVTGSYDYLGGSTLKGTLDNNLLLGTWAEPAFGDAPAKNGPLQFVFTEGWKSFQGVWGNQRDDPLTGIWNGVHVQCPASGSISDVNIKKETLEQEEASGSAAGTASKDNIPDMEEPDYSKPLKEDSIPKK